MGASYMLVILYWVLSSYVKGKWKVPIWINENLYWYEHVCTYRNEQMYIYIGSFFLKDYMYLYVFDWLFLSHRGAKTDVDYSVSQNQ